MLIVPRSHPLSERNSIGLAETIPYPQIFFSKDAGLRAAIDELFQKIGAKPQIAYETQEDQVIAGLVAYGFGIAVVPYMELLRQLDVQIIQIATPTWERDFCPAAQSFRQFVTGRCGKRITSSLWLTASTLLGYEKPPETH